MESKQIDVWQVWRDAVKRVEIDRAIRALYTDLDQAVAERRPVCNASGRCCRFEEYGHRLYVTGLEIAWFLQGVGRRESGVGKAPASNDLSLQQLTPAIGHPPLATAPSCPYQVNGLCSTHTIRPLGCRVFFCEEGTAGWQQDTTERFLGQLKQLHAEQGLPYAYMEWLAGLSEVAEAAGSNP